MAYGPASVVGLFAVVGGAVSLVAGLAGLRHVWRLRGGGVAAWALIKPAPQTPGPAGGHAAGERPVRSHIGERPRLQFTTEDERVIEVVCPVPPTRQQPLTVGKHVLVRYDPADPHTVVIHRRERLARDYGFAGAGLAWMFLGLLVLVFAP
ncbi:DUF3592 domain-containing protein [Streptomyces sp. 71268]|uniref:DUF3592 domain-containing protein n=1 Tax=Streptomyces sp. 71268 TaxID=3002640 RepID=UPI0023F6A0E5|nr:DUF3592 domain-containing protein [Streptomyces sp. 71268]WEV28404.1 DUF3592 domain-containing protein [Streptomyces sp. 71268]